MAKKAKENKPDDAITTYDPGFNKVVDDICRGKYILLLGSDIILNKQLNPEANGDSTKLFLEESYSEFREKEHRDKHPVHSFQELICNNKLETVAVKHFLTKKIIPDIEFQPEELSEDLIRLLKTRCFRLVLTMTFDSSVETLMNEVWGKDKYRIKNISADENCDLSETDILGDEYFDIPPTLYYMFGKAEPNLPEVEFALDDNDYISFISKWLTSPPEKLLSYLETKKILVLGCNLKDWAFRFLWFALRRDKKDPNNFKNLTNGDIAVLLQANTSEQDKNLINYLINTLHIRVQTDSRDYVKKLADALEVEKIAGNINAMANTGGVFISYATEDFAIAYRLFDMLKKANIPVWLDNSKLSVGDGYDNRIEDAIRQCRIFIPLLTSTVAEDLIADKPRYYRDEWKLASGVNDQITCFPIVTSNYDYRQEYHKKVPAVIQKVSVFDWTMDPIILLINKIKQTLNS